MTAKLADIMRKRSENSQNVNFKIIAIVKKEKAQLDIIKKEKLKKIKIFLPISVFVSFYVQFYYCLLLLQY